jgi:hypothetical protein
MNAEHAWTAIVDFSPVGECFVYRVFFWNEETAGSAAIANKVLISGNGNRSWRNVRLFGVIMQALVHLSFTISVCAFCGLFVPSCIMMIYDTSSCCSFRSIPSNHFRSCSWVREFLLVFRRYTLTCSFQRMLSEAESEPCIQVLWFHSIQLQRERATD